MGIWQRNSLPSTLHLILCFYRPQRSCQGYVFTPVCHSVHRGSVCALVHAGIPPPPGKHTPSPGGTPPEAHPPPGKHTHLAGKHPLEAHTPPPGGPLPGDGYRCGRYASYWNAFLFILFSDACQDTQRPCSPLNVCRNLSVEITGPW